jgi:hypothetical protein
MKARIVSEQRPVDIIVAGFSDFLAKNPNSAVTLERSYFDAICNHIMNYVQKSLRLTENQLRIFFKTHKDVLKSLVDTINDEIMQGQQFCDFVEPIMGLGQKNILAIGNGPTCAQSTLMVSELNPKLLTAIDPYVFGPRSMLDGRIENIKKPFTSDKRANPLKGTDIARYDAIVSNMCCDAMEDMIAQSEKYKKPYFGTLCTGKRCNYNSIDGEKFKRLNDRYLFFKNFYNANVILDKSFRLLNSLAVTNINSFPTDRFSKLSDEEIANIELIPATF